MPDPEAPNAPDGCRRRSRGHSSTNSPTIPTARPNRPLAVMRPARKIHASIITTQIGTRATIRDARPLGTYFSPHSTPMLPSESRRMEITSRRPQVVPVKADLSAHERARGQHDRPGDQVADGSRHVGRHVPHDHPHGQIGGAPEHVEQGKGQDYARPLCCWAGSHGLSTYHQTRTRFCRCEISRMHESSMEMHSGNRQPRCVFGL